MKFNKFNFIVKKSITKKSKPIEVGKDGQHPFNSATVNFFSCVITDESGRTIQCMVHKDKWDDLKYAYGVIIHSPRLNKLS